jgi:single-stranded DNA-binding protein
MLINEIHISGTIATEPEARGRGPTKFRLAHGGGGKRKDGSPFSTAFFTIAVWDKTLAATLTKGARVECWGKLHDSSFLKAGVMQYMTEIVSDSIAPQPRPVETQGTTTENIHGLAVSDMDVPF